MSKTKNSGLDQYGAEPFEKQQFETAGAEGVKMKKIMDPIQMISPKIKSIAFLVVNLVPPPCIYSQEFS